MEVFVSGVPETATQRQLVHSLKDKLSAAGIDDFALSKPSRRPFAFITVLNPTAAERFIKKTQIIGGAIRFNERILSFSKSHKIPSEFTLRSLQHKACQSGAKAGISSRARCPVVSFDIHSISCGIWHSPGGDVRYLRYWHSFHEAKLTITDDTFHVVCQSEYSLTFRSRDLKAVVVSDDHTGPSQALHVLIDSVIAPIIHKTTQLGSLGRHSSIDDRHAEVVSSSFVYRVTISGAPQIPAVYRRLQNDSRLRKYVICRTVSTVDALTTELVSTVFPAISRRLSQDVPFSVAFQVLRLALNGVLSPPSVEAMVPIVQNLVVETSHAAVAYGVRKVYEDVRDCDPFDDSEPISPSTTRHDLVSYAREFRPEQHDTYLLAKRHAHILLVHRVQVTPAGVYLEGPHAEVTNRVLRKYDTHLDHFVRVDFMDEDGGALQQDRNVSLAPIYDRFREFLNRPLDIGSRSFWFLGFSHSSLRSHAVWMMASFHAHGQLMVPALLISNFGSFEHIRSPAKCASRIGQAFTDTNGVIIVPDGALGHLEDVERNGRVFSDGCGTISWDLACKIWLVYGRHRQHKPTIFQIRYAGAKGVVSLDPRLVGEVLKLRPSMIKFPSHEMVLGICGSATRPLPMFLNRQFIKILEDLGVPFESFMTLQTEAIDALRALARHIDRATDVLDEGRTAQSARFPRLIRLLKRLEIDFLADTFLSGVLELMVMNKIRDIKYRGRIPVKQAHKLFGIMDETGFLKEGEIYVATQQQSGPLTDRFVLIRDQLLITRSPALHPGDIQLAKAVDVPQDSTLRRLSNCVVFSQYGERDLPSQLAGGDLDGDEYDVIYDDRLMPQRSIHKPADYARVQSADIGRPVESRDMTDFFVHYMENDCLGQICVKHMQLADQVQAGTLDQKCIKLAEMASTAVDFAKTGVLVDMAQMPRVAPVKPDFMAPSPRALMKNNVLSIEDVQEEYIPDFDDTSMLSHLQRHEQRYYTSNKALGKLYRAIDEQGLLRELRHGRSSCVESQSSVMSRLWGHFQKCNPDVDWIHLLDEARRIRNGYEGNMLHVLQTFAPDPHDNLTEQEVFSGNILGREGGAQSKRLRQLGHDMKDRVDEILTSVIGMIWRGVDDAELVGDEDDEAWSRALACMQIGMEEQKGHLSSWTYIVASVLAGLEHDQSAATHGKDHKSSTSSEVCHPS